MPDVKTIMTDEFTNSVNLVTKTTLYGSIVNFTVVKDSTLTESGGWINTTSGHIDAHPSNFTRLKSWAVGDQVTISWTGRKVMSDVKFFRP